MDNFKNIFNVKSWFVRRPDEIEKERQVSLADLDKVALKRWLHINIIAAVKDFSYSLTDKNYVAQMVRVQTLRALLGQVDALEKKAIDEVKKNEPLTDEQKLEQKIVDMYT